MKNRLEEEILRAQIGALASAIKALGPIPGAGLAIQAADAMIAVVDGFVADDDKTTEKPFRRDAQAAS